MLPFGSILYPHTAEDSSTNPQIVYSPNPSPNVNSKVYDHDGNEIGTITAINDKKITVNNKIYQQSSILKSFTSTTKTITTNGTYNAETDLVNGYSSVNVNVSGTQPSGTYTITANGTYDVTNYASADVSVSGGGINLLTARYIEDSGFVSLSFDEHDGSYVLKSFNNTIFGIYTTILLGTTSYQIDTLLSFMQDIYYLKDDGYDGIYSAIISDDYGFTFIPILLPSLNTIEVYDFDSRNLEWTLTLES